MGDAGGGLLPPVLLRGRRHALRLELRRRPGPLRPGHRRHRRRAPSTTSATTPCPASRSASAVPGRRRVPGARHVGRRAVRADFQRRGAPRAGGRRVRVRQLLRRRPDVLDGHRARRRTAAGLPPALLHGQGTPAVRRGRARDAARHRAAAIPDKHVHGGAADLPGLAGRVPALRGTNGEIEDQEGRCPTLTASDLPSFLLTLGCHEPRGAARRRSRHRALPRPARRRHRPTRDRPPAPRRDVLRALPRDAPAARCSTRAWSCCSGRAASASTARRTGQEAVPIATGLVARAGATGSSRRCASRASCSCAASRCTKFLAQVFGNSGDVLKGRQMPSHQSGRAVNQVAWSSCIGPQIPQAVGAAWAMKLKKARRGRGRLLRRRRDEPARLPRRDELRRRLQGARACIVCQNNHWSISVPDRAADRVADDRRQGARVRRARACASTATTCSPCTRSCTTRARARARGRGPHVHRGGDVPHRRALDERRPDALPLRGRGRGVEAEGPARSPARAPRAPRARSTTRATRRSTRSSPPRSPRPSTRSRSSRRPRARRSSTTSTRSCRGTSRSNELSSRGSRKRHRTG